MKPLCIFHGQCADGFAAAWVVRRFFGDGNVDFHAGVYQSAPPDVTGREVVMVDFSYKRAVIQEMRKTARSILILDHHKTAAEDLSIFPTAPGPLEDQFGKIGGWMPSADVYVTFDMDRSGAMITWNHFYPEIRPPKLLEHIQDRDLWLFKLEGTREIQANVFSYPYDFAVWDRLMDTDPQILRVEGAAIERKHHKDIGELVAVTKRFMVIGGVHMPVANLPYTLTSDAGHMMAKGSLSGCAACYWDTPDGRVFSLRSTEQGIDVSAIAKIYGGGGHRNAAGFRVNIGWEGDAP